MGRSDSKPRKMRVFKTQSLNSIRWCLISNLRSCWAFAASTVMSFYVFNRTRKNLIFSPQNLMDCSNVYGNIGCNGGWPPYAFEYLVTKKQTLEENYRYMSSQVSSNLRSRPIYITIYRKTNLLREVAINKN